MIPFPSDEKIRAANHDELIRICRDLAEEDQKFKTNMEKFRDKGVFQDVESTRTFLLNMRVSFGGRAGQEERMPEIKTAIGPIPLLIGNLVLRVSALDNGRWVAEVCEGDKIILTDIGDQPHFQDKRALGRLTAHICDKLKYQERAVREKLDVVLEEMRSSPDAEVLGSEIVQKVIGRTRRVLRETSDPPQYLIEVDGGATMHFTTKMLAQKFPLPLNEQWLAAFNESLDATGKDYVRIRNLWLKRAEDVEPYGNVSEWEPVFESLISVIASKRVHAEPEGLIVTGLYQEGNGPLWVAGHLIQMVMRQDGRKITDGGLAKFMQCNGYLVESSKPIRAGGRRVRAWGLRPDLKPDREEEMDMVYSPSVTEEGSQ